MKEDLVNIAIAYGFDLDSSRPVVIGKNGNWTCFIGDIASEHGDKWLLYSNEKEARHGGISPLEFAAILYRNVKVENQDLLLRVARRNGWPLD